MELNAEQIKKALECCSKWICDECPNKDESPCTQTTSQDALALITSQEQRIKELSEESKKWEEAYDCMHSACRELSDKCERLTDENERLSTALANYDRQTDVRIAENYYTVEAYEELREENESLHASCTELTQCCTKLETLYNIECKRVDTVKADTVRKMQERIAEHATNGYPRKVRLDVIDQIAKEMMEESNERKD